MKKGTILKLSMGVALATAVAVCWTPAARADLSGESDTVTYSQGATTLVMPFDQTGNKVSYELVSVINLSTSADPIATHWSFWADDCRHLRDVVICLTPNDTVLVDPTKLHGEIQQANPPENNPTTPNFNIGKERGSVFVTAFVADLGPSREDCKVNTDFITIPGVLVGSWTIADTGTNAAYGANAIGLSGVTDDFADVPPDPAVLLGSLNSLGEGGLKLQSFNPQTVDDSDVIVLSVDSAGGFGTFDGHEWGPIRRGHDICCDVEYVDDIEVPTSHPQFCFTCTGFAAMAPAGAEAGSDDPILLPEEIDRAGVAHLFGCAQKGLDLGGDDIDDPVGEENDSNNFLFAYHDQAVGQFGVTTSAFYTGISGL
jgi:hypothetical protein